MPKVIKEQTVTSFSCLSTPPHKYKYTIYVHVYTYTYIYVYIYTLHTKQAFHICETSYDNQNPRNLKAAKLRLRDGGQKKSSVDLFVEFVMHSGSREYRGYNE